MLLSESVLQNFKEIFEKEDLLTKLTARDFLHGYSYSEIHCVDYVGKNEYSNVTKIANHLSMTRGAISKIMKSLVKNGAVISFKRESNKKEIYFKLTKKGKKLFDEHAKRHGKWEQRNISYFETIDEKELKIIESFLSHYNANLAKQIKAVKEEK